MRKLLAGIFAVSIPTGIIGINHDPAPNEIMEDSNHTTTIKLKYGWLKNKFNRNKKRKVSY